MKRKEKRKLKKAVRKTIKRYREVFEWLSRS